MSQPIQNRHDFLDFFDVQDGNPNGDPDAGNLPRIDPQTFQGLVTDGCLKRKVRDYVLAAKAEREGSAPGYEIYFQTKGGPEKRVLNTIHQRAHDAVGIKKEKNEKQSGMEKYRDQLAARDWMCQNFYDVRAFGAVMSTNINCGQVRGPVQMTFARSLHPIVQQEVAITRKSVTKPEDAEDQLKKDGGLTGTMGRKAIVPYGLYVAHGFVSANEAAVTGFGEEDLALLWEALRGMFDLDRSASRGLMAARRLYVFRHASKLGNEPAHRLFGRVKANLCDEDKVPRRFEDYEVTLDQEGLPSSVSVSEMV